MSIVLAGLPTTGQHFVEAVSPCLRRFRPITLDPFRPAEVLTCLSAPLEAAEDSSRMDFSDVGLARDVVRLTGGNPFEVMLVANQMWAACELGETERYALTRESLIALSRNSPCIQEAMR